MCTMCVEYMYMYLYAHVYMYIHVHAYRTYNPFNIPLSSDVGEKELVVGERNQLDVGMEREREREGGRD